MKKIQPPQVPKETKTHYFRAEPIFHHYRTITVIDRCECCGHKTGSHKEKRGVGIVGYEIKRYKKDWFYQMNKIMTAQAEARMKFFTGNWDKPMKGEVLKIKRISRL